MVCPAQLRMDRCSLTVTGVHLEPQVELFLTVVLLLLLVQLTASTAGTNCDVCEEGFYGDPVGNSGVQRPCRPCQCNGHISVSSPGSCDGSSGECLKCVNNTTGRSCESCLPDFYHSRASDACRCKNFIFNTSLLGWLDRVRMFQNRTFMAC